MFPSTGHFKSLHCPFHLEDSCGRIYCHFRHVKNIEEKSAENALLLKLEDQICNDLKIDKETFTLIVNEEDENVHEKLLDRRLKTMFPECSETIDNFQFPEPLDQHSFDISTDSTSTEKNVHDFINLTDDATVLDEGILKQFLKEDAKENQSLEHKNRNAIEKRHIIISCLEKIDKREFSSHCGGVVQPRKFSSDDTCTHPVNDKNIIADINRNLKQEDDFSDSSESEDNAEVDKILTQMELLNPQLFNSEKEAELKREPVDIEDSIETCMNSQNILVSNPDINVHNIAPQQTTSAIPPASSKDGFVGRINLKSIQAINNEVSNNIHVSSSVSVKSEKPYEPMFATPTPSIPDPIIMAATIAEQNRLKNVFKNTICSNIDQFFDLSDACKVYGTEIFNLLEPLLNYLIEKLNPEFNFQKLRQLHSQNISLTCGLPFVTTCEHMKHCLECHNILLSALSRCHIPKVNKGTETSSSIINNDTPLRKIEAGLHDITKEMLSLGIPVDEEIQIIDKTTSKSIDTQKIKSTSQKESVRDHRSSIRRHSKDSDKTRLKNKSESSKDQKDRKGDRRHSSSRKHSQSEYRSAKFSSHKYENRKKKHSDEGNENEYKKSSSKSEHRSSKSTSHKHEKRIKENENSENSDDKLEKSNSRNEHRPSKSSNKNTEKRKKGSNTDESSEDEHEKWFNKKHRSSGSKEYEKRKYSSTDKECSEFKKLKRAKSDHEEYNRKSKLMENTKDDSSSENSNDNLDGDNEESLFDVKRSDDYSESEPDDDRTFTAKQSMSSADSETSECEDEEKRNGAENANDFIDLYPNVASKKRVSHVTEGRSTGVYRKPVIPKKSIPTPSEALYLRMQQNRKPEEAPSEPSTFINCLGNSNEKVRISHVPNVALLLKAKERIKNDILHKTNAPVARPTVPQTNAKGHSRIAHVPPEQPKPKDVPAHCNATRPVIDSFKSSHNIPGPTRQSGLDRLYSAFLKKVPPELASELALKEEKLIHEKVTIPKVYLNSLAMAIHRISKEDPAKLIEKTTEYPAEINGYSIYDIASKHILTYEQLEINGFPLPIPSKPGCCRISTKAIHYKPLTSKRNGERFYCQQCKELFDICPETGLPITPSTGCSFHSLRPRKEQGRTRQELYYPCCNKGISESGCVSVEYHTPDTTDDDCLEDFIETREAPPGERGTKRIYSLDCEMCYTTVGVELTRVTIIGHDLSVVYDSLVKPRNRILDYCTKFSGITEEKLCRVTKTIEQVRQELFKFIFKDTILIGHSLENDLKALKILHYKIVDTSVMYPHRDAPERKFSLKYLASNIAHYLIQESEHGHDSKEDALACMKLVWKKMREDAQVHRPRKIIGSPKKTS